ncbi:hypothetical protein M9H77_04196 [Catharanthus roseus]|uniref:Uncharacterized protein n=1 Tax=Catharanthus roseus TaxID=4058 RepID=A0ACC0CDT8_CATRO|nr:hypothetical protein M9H77_04196 [Catharanthus roseus]
MLTGMIEAAIKIKMAPSRDKVMEEVPTKAVDISALEARSKKREDLLLNKEKQSISEDEVALVDKLEGAKVQNRKRTGNREKREKIVSRMQVQANVPRPSSLAPIVEKSAPRERNMGNIPEMQMVDNCVSKPEGEAVTIKLDLDEVIYEVDIVQVQLVEIIRDVTVPQAAIELFFRVLMGDVEEISGREGKEVGDLQRELEAREVGEDGIGSP